MSPLVVLIYVSIIIVVLILIFFPTSRKLLQGFINLFIENRAKTPEGAEAIMTQAIDEAEKNYSEAKTVLQNLSGKKYNIENEIKSAKQELKDIEAKCENLVASGKSDLAEPLAEKRSSLLTLITAYEERLVELSGRVEDAKELSELHERNVRELKENKRMIVTNMKLDQELANGYDMLDKLKHTSATDKLLSVVKEGADESRERAMGAKIVHENKLETRINNANKVASNLERDAYLESLKKKHSQK